MIGRRGLLMGLAAAAGASQASAGSSPRDLNGFWTNLSGTPLERPRAFKALTVSETEAKAYELEARKTIHGVPGDDTGQDQAEWFTPDPPLMRIAGQSRTSIITDPADGRLPYRPEGRQALFGRLGAMNDFAGPEARPAFERCLIGFGCPADAPMLPAAQTSGAYQFVQTRDHFAIRTESNHDLRIVSLTGDPPALDRLRPWMGVSRGRWDGTALVIETAGFNPGESLRSLQSQLYLSPEARVSERLRRISAGEILYGFTVEDPATFTRPWSGELIFRADRPPIYEYGCHEGNYSLPNILAGARRIEAQQQAAR